MEKPQLIMLYFSWLWISTANITFHNIINLLSLKHQFVLIFLYFLAESLSIIWTLFVKNNTNIDDWVSLGLSEGDGADFTTTEVKWDESDTMNNTRKPFVGIRWYAYSIPSLLDFLEKVLVFNGFWYIDLYGLYENGFLVFISLIVSYWINRQGINTHTLLGAFLVLLGFISIFLFIIFNQNNDLKINNHNYIPLILICIGKLFKMIQYFIQSSNVKTFYVTTVKEVAFEGMFGLLFSGVLLLWCNFIPCSINTWSSMCNNNSYENVKDFSTWFIKDLNWIWIGILFITFCFQSLLGLSTMKKTSVLSRIIIENCNIIVYMIIRMCFSLFGKTKPKLSWVYFVGFAWIAVGMLINSEIVVLPFIKSKDNMEYDFRKRSISNKERFLL